MVIAYFLAMLARKKRRCSVAYEVLFAISMATSDAVIAMIFQLAYNYQLGVINKLFGLSIDWLHDKRYALLSLMIIQIWKNVGYNFLFMLSALRGLSKDVLEAAKLDGVTGFMLHYKIMIPLVSPMLFFLLIKDIAYGMTVSSYTLILTGGGLDNATHTIITYIYSKAVSSTNYNYAFAATMIGFVISAVLISFSMILEKKEGALQLMKKKELGSGKDRRLQQLEIFYRYINAHVQICDRNCVHILICDILECIFMAVDRYQRRQYAYRAGGNHEVECF